MNLMPDLWVVGAVFAALIAFYVWAAFVSVREEREKHGDVCAAYTQGYFMVFFLPYGLACAFSVPMGFALVGEWIGGW